MPDLVSLESMAFGTFSVEEILGYGSETLNIIEVMEQRAVMVNWIVEVSVCQHRTLHSICLDPMLQQSSGYPGCYVPTTCLC